MQKIPELETQYSLSINNVAERTNTIIRYLNKQEDNGSEPFIPSVYLKNVAPLEWLKSDDGQEFIAKLEEYQRNKK